jgi:hypothetical protein
MVWVKMDWRVSWSGSVWGSSHQSRDARRLSLDSPVSHAAAGDPHTPASTATAASTGCDAAIAGTLHLRPPLATRRGPARRSYAVPRQRSRAARGPSAAPVRLHLSRPRSCGPETAVPSPSHAPAGAPQQRRRGATWPCSSGRPRPAILVAPARPRGTGASSRCFILARSSLVPCTLAAEGDVELGPVLVSCRHDMTSLGWHTAAAS